MRTIAIAKKVFKELLRDKRTFALMFIAPILIMWLLNIVFSANTAENVRIGAVDVPTKVEEVMKNIDNVSLEGITTKEEAEKKLKEEISYVAEVVDLSADLKKQVENYSGGMKRRLSLAIALLGKPKLLVLDEPTVGIDPALRRKIWRELYKQRDNGVGILITTHVMDEAELCNKVGLLLGGKIIAFDTPKNLKEKNNVNTIEDVFLTVEVK